MSNVNFDPFVPDESSTPREDTTFAEMLSSFEQQHADGSPGETVTGTVVSVGGDTIVVDIGRKIGGVLPRARWQETETADPQSGASINVSVGPRNEEGYYQLSTIKVE